MNFRNRKLYLTARTILGLIFLSSGISGWWSALNHMQGIPPEMLPMMNELWKMGIYQMIKTTELVAGLMLTIGFLPALASIFLAPLCVGIIIFNARIMPQYSAAGYVVTVLNIYLGYAQWDKYKQLFSRK